ncbi:hypothetical protein FKM82_010588 [Ascaphus truei]
MQLRIEILHSQLFKELMKYLIWRYLCHFNMDNHSCSPPNNLIGGELLLMCIAICSSICRLQIIANECCEIKKSASHMQQSPLLYKISATSTVLLYFKHSTKCDSLYYT